MYIQEAVGRFQVSINSQNVYSKKHYFSIKLPWISSKIQPNRYKHEIIPILDYNRLNCFIRKHDLVDRVPLEAKQKGLHHSILSSVSYLLPLEHHYDGNLLPPMKWNVLERTKSL